MKIDLVSSKKLKSDIRERFATSEQTYSAVGRTARVHPSQVSRICRGKFKTLSHNVVQVCKALGVQIETVKLDGGTDDLLTQQLEQSVIALWDRTPTDAKRLMRFLNQLAELRRAPAQRKEPR